ncbi:MAG: hypothetical protein IH899_08885 [Planctomycetes bacterium]|nr:hypothetical protein [Planctomycetota bacterium]
MARDATARLYDVDDDSVVYKRPKQQGKYDHGTIGFRAKKGKLIDLDKLHESIWATRLSGGTRSGLVHLDVTAVGEATINGKQTTLNVTGTNRRFVLIENPDHKSKAGEQTAFERLQEAISRDDSLVSVTGRLEGWKGRWPGVLSKKPSKPRRIMVTSFEIIKK